MQLIAVAGDDREWDYPKPGKSKIVFELIDEDTYEWTVWDAGQKRHREVGLMIDEIQFEGGSAEIEAEQGMLNHAVYDLLDPFQHGAGWWVIEGFYGIFRRGDGWTTDDDVDFECDGIRPARWSDLNDMGIMRPPMWARFAIWLGLDPLV
jgi:hypothetical protein